MPIKAYTTDSQFKNSGRTPGSSKTKHVASVAKSAPKIKRNIYEATLTDVEDVKEVMDGATETEVAVISAMILNGGNASQAAKTLGMNASYVRRMVSNKPVIRKAVELYKHTMLSSLVEWSELIPLAKGTLQSLLHDPDGKVRYLAAKEILDRAEGKAVARVDMKVTDERPVLSELEVQLAFSMMKDLGWDYAACVQYIRDNPAETQQWVDREKERLRIASESQQRGGEGTDMDADYEIV